MALPLLFHLRAGATSFLQVHSLLRWFVWSHSFKFHQKLLTPSVPTLALLDSQNFKIVDSTVYVTSLLELSNMHLKIKPKTNLFIFIPSNRPLFQSFPFQYMPPTSIWLDRTLQVFFDFFLSLTPSYNSSSCPVDSFFQSSSSLHIHETPSSRPQDFLPRLL